MDGAARLVREDSVTGVSLPMLIHWLRDALWWALVEAALFAVYWLLVFRWLFVRLSRHERLLIRTTRRKPRRR